MKRRNDEKQKNNSMLPKTKKANFTSVAIIIAACVLIIVATLMAVIFGTGQNSDNSGKEQLDDTSDNSGKEQLDDTIKLNILSGSLVEETQYNVWFNIDCDKTEGTITLTPTIGFVMCMENANEANVKIVESINVTDVDKYTYIWCVDKEDKDQIGYVDVAFEDKTQLKTASIYALFHEGTIGFLERDQYAEYEDAVQKANGSKNEEDVSTDKVKATGVQTDFRSFQLAAETVARENAGFSLLVDNDAEGEAKYAALEAALNKNLDPKLHVEIDADGKISTKVKDPWEKAYNVEYITSVEGQHRGAFVFYCGGTNLKINTTTTIENGVVEFNGSADAAKDDYAIAIIYTFAHGYGEVISITTGFSNS